MQAIRTVTLQGETVAYQVWRSAEAKQIRIDAGMGRTRLVLPEVVDYVVAHELAHEKHPNHGSKFWRLVADRVSEYQEWDDWLNENGQRLVFDTQSHN